ncbi:discoidin domain-containing protein [Erysipelatoclostridium ramosum]|uniref:Discoidin domain-containing protein n=1 Tax=Thomasclavelia ramosa TaxID=1547 RepID=A0AB35IEC5_9FIRM|nr:discoidin domain-containing protein [Thomasclavelia ramosa]MDB7082682.1 discoidin domain-containing protein [Thomasclavelia ramosa]
MEKTKVKKLVTSAITLSMAFSTLAPSMVFATDDVKPRDIVTKVNHALNGTATANNSETSYWGPDKAIDGIVNRDAAKPDQSRWSTNMGTTPMVLTIDLKEEKAFSEFKIEWERKNIKGFNISISNDNNEYTPVYTKPDDSNITSLTTTVTLENSVSARYVKLTVDNYDDTEAAGWASVSLYEFEVLGEESYENLAVGATAVASGSETTSFGPANVVDENMKTRWASTANHDDDKWISLDFGIAKDIASVTLKWERRNATKYKIQSSKNGTSWEDVKTLTKAPREFDDIINFDNTINTRYLRVVVSDFENLAEDRDGKSVNWPTVSLYEFEAYAVKQQVDSEQIVTIDDVINNLVIPAVAKGDTKMALPQVPEGFEIEFIGADYEQILDRDLTIHQPIVDTIVSVNYKVKKGDQEKITGAYNVTIPGKNSPDVSINAKPKVVPELAEWVGTEGSFTISDDSRIVINPAYKDDLAYLAKTFKADYQAQTGKEIEVVYANTPGAHDFYFTLGSSDTGLKEEGYLMTVGDSVKVEAVDKTGAFWATQSILQILKQNSNTIPNGQTRDYPKYEVRGFMLDVGRMPYSLDILKDIAKNMAYYKMNDFQVHLNDNYIWVEDYGDNAFDAYSGFRLESDIKAGGNGGLNQADLTSKDVFYTKDQFRTFIQECRDMGVAVVPEFDTPAHSLALTKVRPDLAMKDKSVARHWDHLDLDSMYDESLAFTQSIFNEYMNGDDPVFDQNTTVNVGTDEYDGKYAENFRQYTDDMLKFIQDTGRDVRLWGSLSMRKGSTPVRSENVQMNIWNTSWANPNEMYKQGFDLINMVDGTLYMVPGAGYYNDYLNSQNIYNNWQPNNMGGTIIPAGDEQMLGSAYAIWNDMVDKKANGISEYDIYDRFEKALPAMSSKLWGDGQDLKYNELNEVVNSLGTAPNSNPRDVVTSKSDTVLNYDFNKSEIVDKSGNEYNVVNKKNVATVAGKFSKGLELSGGESYIETPLADMGPNNSVSFWVKMDKDATGEQVLFESDKGSIKMSQKDTGKVGFSRIGYDYSFNYELPKDEWVKLEIKGYANKAELYVNGELVDTLAKNATGGKYATLTLPLERIGSKTTSFKGIIDNLEISITGSQSDDTDYTKVDSSNFTVSTDNENPQAGNEGPITYAFDNNEVTFWHSNYSPYQALPATVEIDMKEVHTINQFDYLPRQDGNTNGQITKYELYIKENAADEYQKVSEGELAANASLKKITFDAANARYIKFVALEGTGNGGKSFACASEFTVRQIDSKAELRKVVNLAANYEKEYYTTASWNDFETALTNAQMILDKADASSTEIDDAASALKTAIDSLVEIGDVVKTELERVIAEAQSIDTTKYTDKTVDVLKTALVNAISINGNENATQEEVNAAITALTNAIDELELKTDVSVDKTDLEALLNICGTIDLNNYQENGKAEFKAAYEYALSIFNEADATEQEIRDAMNRLLEAKKNLKEIEVTPTDPGKNGQDKPIDNKVETGDNINVLYSASGLALASIVFYFSKKRKRSN